MCVAAHPSHMVGDGEWTRRAFQRSWPTLHFHFPLCLEWQRLPSHSFHAICIATARMHAAYLWIQSEIESKRKRNVFNELLRHFSVQLCVYYSPARNYLLVIISTDSCKLNSCCAFISPCHTVSQKCAVVESCVCVFFIFRCEKLWLELCS